MRRLRRLAAGIAAVATALACDAAPPAPSQAFARARANGSAPEREWRTYLGDRAVSHASPLAQIDRRNVASLQVAWRYDAGGTQPGRSSQMQFNPLVVKGVLYGASPALRLFALDATTGAELWSFTPDVRASVISPSRGAVYWEDGPDERILFGAGPHLYALDARSGLPIRAFGDDGRLDLRLGLGRDVSDDMMGVLVTTPGSVFEDLLIVGGRVNELSGAAPGHVRAFDIRTGEMRWIFHTIPRPGEFGHDTWPPDAWQQAGGANSWAGFSVDAERGLVFVPTGSATPDFSGAARRGDDLFANSLIALDARTGERRWHYQVVRHDLWDRDLPAPPNLVEIEREGVRIPAVAQVTKTGDTFLFERETGAPLFPIREEPVHGPAMAGEFPAPSQPLPTRPPPFVRQVFSLAELADRSPLVHEKLAEQLATLRSGPLYLAPSAQGTLEFPGTDGGAEWGGAAWDQVTGLLFVNANQTASIVRMIELPKERGSLTDVATGYLFACGGCHGSDLRGDGVGVPSLVGVGERMGFLDLYRTIRDGRGRMPALGGTLEWWQSAALAGWVYFAGPEDAPAQWASGGEGSGEYLNAGYQEFVGVDGLPGIQPPWGTFTALDLAHGEIRWQVPLGDFPQTLAAGQRGLGAQNYGGPVVTAGGLLFLAATPDQRLRAFDVHTGDVLWEAELPAAGFATPATYEASGRQFVVIAAGGGKLKAPSGSEYVAFALPETP